jgi:hypothetical protein
MMSADANPTDLRLRLLANGWTPVPITAPDYQHASVKSPGKQPLMKGWQELRHGTLTEDTVRTWSRLQNQPGTGVLAGVSRLAAVDIDVTNQELSEAIQSAANNILGPTPFVRIGKAPKALRLYRLPNEAKKLMTPELIGPDGDRAQVEVLGLGQQFVAYGIHPDTQKPYEWPRKAPATHRLDLVPETTLDALNAFLEAVEGLLRNAGYVARSGAQQREAASTNPQKTKLFGQTHKDYPPPTRDDVADALRAIPNTHDWHGWVKIGAAIFNTLGDDGKDLYFEWSAQSPKNDPEATREKWRSFHTSPMNEVTAATLFREARDRGWRPARERRSSDGIAQGSTLDGLSYDPQTGEILSDAAQARRPAQPVLRLMTIAELEALPPPEWLIEGLIPEKGLVVPYGPPKVGKTFIVLSMALHVAAGRQWFGRRVKQGLVVYIAGEGVGGLPTRITAMRHRYDLPSDVQFRVAPKAVNFRDPDMVRELVALAREAAGGQPIAMVVIDTLARAMPGVDENSAQEVGMVIAQCDLVRDALGCTVVPIHHTGKDQERGMRGSNAIHGAVDATLRIKGAGKGRVVVINEDQKDGEPAPPMTFLLEEISTGLRSSLVPVLEEGRAVGRPKGEEPDDTELLTRVVIAMEGQREAPLRRLAEAVTGSPNGRAAQSLAALLPTGAANAVPLQLGGTRVRLWKRIAGEQKTSPIYVVQEQEGG